MYDMFESAVFSLIIFNICTVCSAAHKTLRFVVTPFFSTQGEHPVVCMKKKQAGSVDLVYIIFA